MFGIFKKKDDHKWNHLHLSLSNSFGNIKQDISDIYAKIVNSKEDFSTELKQAHRRMDKIEGMIENILRFKDNEEPEKIKPKKIKIKEIESEQEETEEEIYDDPLEEEIAKGADPVWSHLTPLQQILLICTTKLSKEGSRQWITLKGLANEVNPNRDYSEVRSLISSYTDNLMDLGFLMKKRRGRQTCISLTKKALKHMPKGKELEKFIIFLREGQVKFISGRKRKKVKN